MIGPLRCSDTEIVAGRWSARVVVAISVAYATAMVAGFVSLGNVRDPLPDPYFAVAEVLILLMAPVMVVLMAVICVNAPVRVRLFGLMAFGWMLVAACLTMTVHVVELTVARRVDPSAIPGFPRLFDFAWPSMLYAVDVVAWDLLLGLSLLCAAVVFAGRRYRAVRVGLLVSGVLCLVGLIGPATGVLAWRAIGIFGYIVVFPLTCVALSRVFASASSSGTDAPVSRVRARDELVTDRP
ncbi:MAG: hypothetical protein QOJ30_2617 [Pseudonocardiales bacterium]|nr:hypothetical protein [Pseudonocardiales bacterium]